MAPRFYEGSQRLLKGATYVVPVRPTAGDRVLVEAHQALVALALGGETASTSASPPEPGEAPGTRMVLGAARRRLRGVPGLRSSLKGWIVDPVCDASGADYDSIPPTLPGL